jgi:hypothetical protein
MGDHENAEEARQAPFNAGVVWACTNGLQVTLSDTDLSEGGLAGIVGWHCVPYEDLEATERSAYYILRSLQAIAGAIPKLIP